MTREPPARVAARYAREQQVGDVDAGNSSTEADHAEEQPQRGLRLARQEIVLQQLDARPHPLFEVG